ncbi:rhodanese-like domain-containing protein [Salinibacterium sp. G-O1]|uniref:rhodanese-like domain-containing protein n=1 Tax=Salinibacterium sp. G-O1 TaxID=3046208 RepID=UPI0024B92637|nr:rhodanese-like domain-containing protein [Salinibacterium sp. G-O1]MDJ0336053.1 rhodanese-like domain-containing protein [Salinibacterium sp. G-O1]
MKRVIARIALAAAVLVGLAGCAPASIEMTPDTVVVDVRTSDEYSAGHLDGAVNIDVRAADFDTRVSELPQDGRYVVYCASGNRSASAVSRMANLGFTDLVDAGGMSSASSSTGLAVVTTG